MKRKAVVIFLVILAILVVITVVLLATLIKKDSKDYVKKQQGVFSNAAVASDATLCNNVGKNILQDGGNAVDCAVATLFCLGVVNAMSCGIGGGGFMVVFDDKTNKTVIYDYREVAPTAANETMFVGNISSKFGGLSIAVPGQVKGLWEVHKNHGKLKWKQLFNESIRLADEGFHIHKPLNRAVNIVIKNNSFPFSKGLRDLFKKGNGWKEEGDLLVNKKLAATLRNIKENGTKDFYEGELAKKIVEDIQKAGGIVTLDDMKNYKVVKREPLELKLPKGMKLLTMPAPGGGPTLAFIHNILSGYDFSGNSLSSPEESFDFYQKLIESMKFGYAQRSLLGDPAFVPKDNITYVESLVVNLTVGDSIRKNKIWMNQTFNESYYGGFWGEDEFGTSHSSIIDKNGMAVSSTNTINYLFGSLVLSSQTGIIFNDEMDDFSTPNKSNIYGYPPTPANFIRPGKRPLSSMVPSIITAKGKVKMIIGASGGSRIISSVAQVIAKKIYLKDFDLFKSIDSYRLHHQGVPNEVTAYKDYKAPEGLPQKLIEIGHKYRVVGSHANTQGIFVDNGKIQAMSDPRKQAVANGY